MQVFICHARPDAAVARSAYKRLRRAGFDPWLAPDSIRAGEEWELAIERALQESQVVMVLLSKASIARDGFLQGEIRDALRIGKQMAPGHIYILPVRIEAGAQHERLAKLQWIDAFDEIGWRRLLAQLHALRKAAAH